jgi:hypothetical protein
MIWRDILSRGDIPDNDIIQALGTLFQLPAQDVAVSDSLEDIGRHRVFCLKSVLAGNDFNFMVTIYAELKISDALQSLQTLSLLLNRELLVADDDTQDPYSMLLIKPNSQIVSVRVSADRLDSNDEYLVVNG